MGCDENCECGGGFTARDKLYPKSLRELRVLLSDLEEARNELSDEVREVQRLIDKRENEVRPSTVEIECVIHDAISSRWPNLKTSSVSDVYDVYVISIVED